MSHLKMTAWGLEKMMVRVQAVTTIILALLLCAAQLRDSSGDWIVISLIGIRHCLRYFVVSCSTSLICLLQVCLDYF